MHQPEFAVFKRQSPDYDYVPVYRRLLSDTHTPVSAFRCLDRGGPGCLFESVIGGEKVGRYSFLATQPVKRFAARGPQVSVTFAGGAAQSFQCDDPLDELRKHLDATVAPAEDLPPFIGGAIGYAAYDVIRYVENLPHAPADDRGLPDLDFSFYQTMLVFDNIKKTITLVTLADGKSADAKASYDEATARLDAVVERLSQPQEPTSIDFQSAAKPKKLEIESNFTREAFCEAVQRCVQYIHAGDIFQVVPSQRFSMKTDVPPIEIYRSLRVVNPSPFMFFVRTGDADLIGCSPEIMCRVADRRVTVRPLAGTRRRGVDEREDRQLELDLLADPKEIGEHVMLVDLGRNDVGRVAQFGSVELTEVMGVQRYSHVMHISSEVQGTLREGLDCFDALKACLPAGTVSGAPKERAMEIIDELEPHRRGPYGGAVGYIDYRGNMDTCIALRTMVVKDGMVHVQAGCGVVADSQPDAEYEETVSKAKALITAIEMTIERVEST
ncbi:MAG: anthranilate synthase component I [Planctomycetaceae bacterium]